HRDRYAKLLIVPLEIYCMCYRRSDSGTLKHHSTPRVVSHQEIQQILNRDSQIVMVRPAPIIHIRPHIARSEEREVIQQVLDAHTPIARPRSAPIVVIRNAARAGAILHEVVRGYSAEAGDREVARDVEALAVAAVEDLEREFAGLHGRGKHAVHWFPLTILPPRKAAAGLSARAGEPAAGVKRGAVTIVE